MKKRTYLLFSTLIFLTLLLLPPINRATDWSIIAYDDGDPEYYISLPENTSVAVKFTPTTDLFKLTGIVIYSDTSNLTQVQVSVLNASNFDVLMDPIIPSPAFGPPPYDVDFGDNSLIFIPTNVTEFYVVVQWIMNNSPYFGIGIDESEDAGRSYINQTGTLQLYTGKNVMIRARVDDINAPTFDYIPLQYGMVNTPLSISVEVLDEFKVESVTLAYRTNGSTSYDTTSLTLVSGDTKRGIWYGQIPAEYVTTAGVEYYIWATDSGFNQRYYGNATTPFYVQIVKAVTLPLYLGIIIIVAICAAAIAFYFYLPKYEGAEPR